MCRLIILLYQIELVDYRYYHSRPIGIIEMLSDLKKIAKLGNTGVYLSNQLVINVDTTSKYIESKVVEIIDSQVICCIINNI